MLFRKCDLCGREAEVGRIDEQDWRQLNIHHVNENNKRSSNANGYSVFSFRDICGFCIEPINKVIRNTIEENKKKK